MKTQHQTVLTIDIPDWNGFKSEVLIDILTDLILDLNYSLLVERNDNSLSIAVNKRSEFYNFKL